MTMVKYRTIATRFKYTCNALKPKYSLSKNIHEHFMSGMLMVNRRKKVYFGRGYISRGT